MTATNRFLNRLILLIVGLAALALAVVIAVPAVPALADWARPYTAPLADAVSTLDATAITWVAAATLLVVVVFCIAWISTRGRGRTSSALVTPDGIVIDDSVVAGLIRRGLEDEPDVLAVSAQGYRRAGGAVLVRVETRSRASLPALLARLRTTVDTTDRTIGTAVPLVIHLTTGVRTIASGSRTTR